MTPQTSQETFRYMTSKKIIIREYWPEDVQDLVKIFYNTVHKINIRDYSEEQVNVWAPETSLAIKKWVEKFERTQPFVAIIDNTIVGFVEFESDGHIDCFYCHHEWMGYGVGSALMNTVDEKARQQKIQRIYADVSITARPFFEKRGFTVTQEQTILVRGVQLTNFKMEKHFNIDDSK
jgi:putative acetyltransferase